MPAAAAIDSCPTSVSTQPRLPQAHRRPSGSTETWPNSPPNPCVPRNSRPPSTTPPPTPTSPKTQTKSSIPTAAPVQCSARAARFDSFSTSTGSPSRVSELVGDGDPVPAEVRREDDRAGRLLDQAGHGHRDPDRPQALAGRGVERGARGASEPVEHRSRSRAAVVAVGPVLVAHRAGQVLDRDGDVVDVDLEPDPDHHVRQARARRPDARHRAARAPRPFSRTKSSATSSATRLETVPRVRPVPAATSAREHEPVGGDVAKDDAEVRPSDRRLVGATRASPGVEGQRRSLTGEAIGIVRGGIRALLHTTLYGGRPN